MQLLIKKIKQNFKTQDKVIFFSVTSILIMAFTILLIWAINFKNLPQQLPLFYSLPWGTPQLASISQFLILISVIILIMLTNLIISWHLHPSQILLKRIISITGSVTSFLILLTSLKIIYTFI